ncbi:MAG: SIMPL domain-containing protein [Parcubacteria group bacterium]|nr:SIMPL domain-containing protein [Parcubacteria group bacterium]
MNELFQNKRFMRAVVVLLFSGSLYLIGQFLNGLKEYSYVGLMPSAPATIQVSGMGEVFAKPDIAEFSFSVSKDAKTIAEAQKVSAEKINEIMAFLKESGIDEKDIKTENYSLNPKYEWQEGEPRLCIQMVGAYCPPPGGKQILVGYEVNQTISVKIRKIDDSGKILVGVGEKGATNISGVGFSVDEKDAIEADARAEAIQDAEEKAKVLAKSLGVRITRIVSFSENGFTPMYQGFDGEAMSLKAADAVVPPEVPVGENKFVSNVNIIYEIR